MSHIDANKKRAISAVILFAAYAGSVMNCWPQQRAKPCKEDDTSSVLTAFQRSVTMPKHDARVKLAAPVLGWRLRDDGSVLSVVLARSSSWKPLDKELLDKAKELRFPGAAKCGVHIFKVEFTPSLFSKPPD